MSSTKELVIEMLNTLGVSVERLLSEDVARIQVHKNKIVGLHLVKGLRVEAEEIENGIEANVEVEENIKIEKPIHLCFGVMPEEGIQKVKLNLRAKEGSKSMILAHCTFPNAKNVKHLMEANIVIEANAQYAYFERHVHSPFGGVEVIPYASIYVGENAEFSTEFELINGSAGKIDFNYEVKADDKSKIEMVARISGVGKDIINLNEQIELRGRESAGVIATHIAVRDYSSANVKNVLTAIGPNAKGHVDCKEIVVGNAKATAVPVVSVLNPTAHVTHEAAIGSVDAKQLITLMTRGLTEEEATEVIIQGMLSKKHKWGEIIEKFLLPD
ncbi:MAG: SufD family Fe-S cluster assembly protein [Candidatus Hydrogenedentes bacterium]|nr:SufD family Fe-S cluster assembly protein [Candidatus Hydrogenedentota bacterium]